MANFYMHTYMDTVLGTFIQSSVHNIFKKDGFGAPLHGIARENYFRLAICNPLSERLRGEAGKNYLEIATNIYNNLYYKIEHLREQSHYSGHHRVDGTDPSTCQHGDGQLH